MAQIYDLLQLRQYRKALNTVAESRKKHLSLADQTLSLIIEAQIERRRSAYGSLARSYRLLAGVNINDLAVDRLPLYFYERGYTCQMLGLHQESIACFRDSFKAACALNDQFSPFERTVATLRQYAVETIAIQGEAAIDPQQIAQRSAQFDVLINEASNMGQPFGGRWVYNVMGWKWKYLLKCRNYDTARSVYEEARGLRFCQDVTTGYTRDTGSRACGFEALILLHGQPSEEDLREVLRLVCRSLVSLLSFRIRPEAIRDFLFTLETALRRFKVRMPCSHRDTISTAGRVRNRILDGSSFLDPYRSRG